MFERIPAKARPRVALLMVLVLIAVPLATAATSGATPRPVRAEDLAEGVPLEALDLPEAWEASVSEGIVRIEGASAGTATLLVEGVPYFAHRISAKGDPVAFLLDGRNVVRYEGEPQADDFALAAGRHTLVWRFDPKDEAASFVIELMGMQAVTPPLALPIVDKLAACAPLHVVARFAYVEPITAGALRATWDGTPVDITAASVHKDYDVVTSVDALVPPELVTGGQHTLRIERVGEEVVPLLDKVLTLVDGALALYWPPEGWIYDRTPTIRLDLLGCDPAGTTIQLFVDGEEIGEPTTGLSREFSFGREVAFGEEHSYRFVATFPSGLRFEQAATFTQGLDVVEYELTEGHLVYASWGAVATFDARAGVGELLEARAVVTLPSALVRLSADAIKVRAEYAPLELSCVETGERTACLPYGGGAPDYWLRQGYLAPAAFMTESMREEPAGAGQLAAAAWFSKAPELLAELSERVESEAEG